MPNTKIRPKGIGIKMKKLFLLLLVVMGFGVGSSAQKIKTINVTPDNAKIYMGGIEVGSGTYELTMKKQDFVVLRLSAPGYIDKTVRINKSDKRNAYSFTLEEDDSWNASDVNSDLANKTMTIKVGKDISPDDVWKRLSYYISESFSDLQTNDKSQGWIRTAWAIQTFNYVTIRTRLEVKEVPGMDVITYKVTLSSEWAPRDCGLDDQCFRKWDRILKRYNQCVKDLQNSLE